MVLLKIGRLDRQERRSKNLVYTAIVYPAVCNTEFKLNITVSEPK